MANYNTFAVVESKHGKILLVTSSARKANSMLCVGNRVEVWNSNEKSLSITHKNKDLMTEFVRIEKEYIRMKQDRAAKKTKDAVKRQGNLPVGRRD